MKKNELTYQETRDILHLVHSLYGYDFRGYAPASLKRRLVRIMDKNQMDLEKFKFSLVNDPAFIPTFINELTVNVTEMFRDPFFYTSVRKNVVPYLETWPAIRIWNAGCSTGEEVYSFAMLISQAGLLERTHIYGTDLNREVIKRAREGIYSLKQLKLYAENYYRTGADEEFSNYYNVRYDAGIMSNELKKKITFSEHNLVSDLSFNTFQLIVCRNVYIYFELGLQEKVLKLFYDSLCPFGFLCLGAKETIRFSNLSSKFKVIDKEARIYQKVD